MLLVCSFGGCLLLGVVNLGFLWFSGSSWGWYNTDSA